MVAANFEYMLGWIFDFYICSRFGSGQKRARTRRQRGFVLVICALFLTVLMAIGGFAVDLGQWYWNASRLQRAADGASLAGAPFLPNDLGAAKAAAVANLKTNGYDNVTLSAKPLENDRTDANRYTTYAYVAQSKFNPNVLHVEVSRSFPNYLTSLLGYNSQYLQRSANGYYKAKIQVGSPSNVLGNNANPEKFPAQNFKYEGNYWLNISGGNESKDNGDRYVSANCDSPGQNQPDNCKGSVNQDFPYGSDQVRSHRFIVTVPENISGDVVVQVFDPVVADHCDNPQLGTFTPADVFPAPLPAEGVPANLYAKDPTNANSYCTGDQNVDGHAPVLTLTSHEPSTQKNKLGAQLDSKTWGEIGNGDNLRQKLSGAANAQLREGFRRWTDFTTLPNAPGKYGIEATVPANSEGTNHFSLRVGVRSGGVWSDTESKKVGIEADKHFTVFTNASGSSSSFYFAKLPGNLAGRTLDVPLYDIGDTAEGDSVSLQLLPPTGARGSILDPKRGFGTCEQRGPSPMAPKIVSPCGITNATYDKYNGHIVKLRIVIPNDYTCTEIPQDRSACWMGMRFALSSGTTGANPSHDTTTWEVKECGATRLVPDDYTFSAECGDDVTK